MRYETLVGDSLHSVRAEREDAFEDGEFRYARSNLNEVVSEAVEAWRQASGKRRVSVVQVRPDGTLEVMADLFPAR